MHEFSHQIYYSIRKVSETHRMETAWEIGSHAFSINWSLFSIRFPSCGILHHMGNASVFSSISHSMENNRKPSKWEKPGKLVPGKILQNPSYVENFGNWYSYLSHSMGVFFPLDSHLMVYFIICEIHGSHHQFLIAWENAAKSIELRQPGKLVPIAFPKYEYFSSIRFPSYGILYHMGNAWLFPSISNSTEKCSKIHPVSSQVAFPRYYCFYLFQNRVIP